MSISLQSQSGFYEWVEYLNQLVEVSNKLEHSTYLMSIKSNGKVVTDNKKAVTIGAKGADKMEPIMMYVIHASPAAINTSSARDLNKTPTNSSSLDVLYRIASAPACREEFDKLGSGKLEVEIAMFQTTHDEKTAAQEGSRTKFENCGVYAHTVVGEYGLVTLTFDGYDGNAIIIGTDGQKDGKSKFGDQKSNK